MSRDYIEHGLPWTWTAGRVEAAIREADINVVVAGERGAISAFGIMSYPDDDAHLLLFAVRQESAAARSRQRHPALARRSRAHRRREAHSRRVPPRQQRRAQLLLRARLPGAQHHHEVLSWSQGRHSPGEVAAARRGSAAERNAVTPGIEVRRYGVERQRDAPLAGIDRHGVHEVAREQHHVTGFGRRADPLVRVVGVRWRRRRDRS